MIQLISRILSLMIAAAYAIFMVVAEHGLTGTVFKGCLLLLLPLALIWFPDALGSLSIWGERVAVWMATEPHPDDSGFDNGLAHSAWASRITLLLVKLI